MGLLRGQRQGKAGSRSRSRTAGATMRRCDSQQIFLKSEFDDESYSWEHGQRSKGAVKSSEWYDDSQSSVRPASAWGREGGGRKGSGTKGGKGGDRKGGKGGSADAYGGDWSAPELNTWGVSSARSLSNGRLRSSQDAHSPYAAVISQAFRSRPGGERGARVSDGKLPSSTRDHGGLSQRQAPPGGRPCDSQSIFLKKADSVEW
eukprot:TRINITY_DN51397_c0_g1_i1.p1 TRINITY_DN51397_c0_g1~~TRINITY_DN51397_c0_g1_i1.p1  ORF type:complete len:204 (-),score=41.45 TRINITY_DN51397_c0_g1_i1:145-756(-)